MFKFTSSWTMKPVRRGARNEDMLANPLQTSNSSSAKLGARSKWFRNKPENTPAVSPMETVNTMTASAAVLVTGKNIKTKDPPHKPETNALIYYSAAKWYIISTVNFCNI